MPTIKVSETTYLNLNDTLIKLVNESRNPKITYDDAIAHLIKRNSELEVQLKQKEK